MLQIKFVGYSSQGNLQFIHLLDFESNLM